MPVSRFVSLQNAQKHHTSQHVLIHPPSPSLAVLPKTVSPRRIERWASQQSANHPHSPILQGCSLPSLALTDSDLLSTLNSNLNSNLTPATFEETDNLDNYRQFTQFSVYYYNIYSILGQTGVCVWLFVPTSPDSDVVTVMQKEQC